MASSDPEIKDGFPIPIWMKSKPTREFEPFAASPPAPEDSFFFIRYPKSEKETPRINLEQDLPKVDLSKVVSDQGKELASASYNFKEKDWSKHTKPCQDVLHGIQPINTAVNSTTSKPKPAGTDDGFKGEGAACGNSLVKVAHQMISTSRGGSGGSRGFTVAAPEEEEAMAPEPHQYNLAARRGSKSLPTTPNTSPTSRRKRNTNRYFTSPFEPVEAAGGRSWLAAALLGFKKDLASSTSTLAEEDDVDHRLQGISLAQSVENLGPAPRGRSQGPSLLSSDVTPPPPAKPSPAFRAKPTELREMNFWSPTSM